MALVSVQNFMAPFENKTHLFSIIAVAAIFGLWRLTGGTISVRAKTPVPGASVQAAPLGTTAGTPTRAGANRLSSSKLFGKSPSVNTAGKSPSSTPFLNLDALLQPSAPQRNAPPQKKRPHSALDNIEKTLGLR